MITGNKKDIAKLLPYVSQRLGTALQYIAETNFTNVKNGEYHLDGDKVFARVDRTLQNPKTAKSRKATMTTLMYSIWGKARKRFIIRPKQIHIKS